ncbi:MAG: hypothetical protein JXQ87_14745 [Bacteroidia bacterium]
MKITMLKKWLNYITVGLILILVVLLLSKPKAESILGDVNQIVPAKSRVTLKSVRDYYFFNAIQVAVHEPGNMFNPGNSYVLTYMGILGQTIDLSKHFK